MNESTTNIASVGAVSEYDPNLDNNIDGARVSPTSECRCGPQPLGRFNWYRGNGCYEIDLDASMNSGTTFVWDFGDGQAGLGNMTTHNYANAGTYPVTLTIDGELRRTVAVTVRPRHIPPITGSTVEYDPADVTGMTVRVTDNSTDNSCSGGTGTGLVLWGDGTTTLTAITTGGFVGSHRYSAPGTYHIVYSFEDSEGNKAVAPSVTVTLPSLSSSVYTVSGTICSGANNGDDDCADPGESPLPNATVYLKKGQTIMKVGKTDSFGRFAIQNVQELPGDAFYTVVPQKTAYSFAPATGDSDQVNKADPVANFRASTEW